MSNEARSETVSRYAALLADQNFNFTPYFDEAVCLWLRSNLRKLLEEQPEACRYFIRDPQHSEDVATVISLEEVNRRHLSDFLLFLEKTNSWYAFRSLAERMMDAKMADIVYELAPTLSRRSHDLINLLSEEKFNTYVASTTPDNFDISEGNIFGFFKRVPKDQVKRFIVPVAEYRHAYSSMNRARIVSSLAQVAPLEDIQLFKIYLDTKYWHEFICMSCGNKEAKSRPGYSLHRNKGCDPKGTYPNLTETIGHRLYHRV